MTESLLVQLLGPEDGSHLRGVKLGDPIADVIAREGEDFEHRTDAGQFYQYDRQVDPDVFFFYLLTYWYRDGRVDQIGFSMTYNMYEEYDLSLDEFSGLIDALIARLTRAYGEPTEKVTSHGREREVALHWIDEKTLERPVEVVLTQYRNEAAEIEKGFNLQFAPAT